MTDISIDLQKYSSDTLEEYYKYVRCISWAKQKFWNQDPATYKAAVQAVWKKCGQACLDRKMDVKLLCFLELKVRGLIIPDEPERHRNG